MSDPTAAPAPDPAPDAGTAEPVPEPETGGAPRADIASAPAAQERDAGSGDLPT